MAQPQPTYGIAHEKLHLFRSESLFGTVGLIELLCINFIDRSSACMVSSDCGLLGCGFGSKMPGISRHLLSHVYYFPL